jgi:hypothetical protein
MKFRAISRLLTVWVGAGCAVPGPNPKANPVAAVDDPNRARAQQLIAALAAGDPEAAERDFTADLPRVSIRQRITTSQKT